jgi:hypothetical protein
MTVTVSDNYVPGCPECAERLRPRDGVKTIASCKPLGRGEPSGSPRFFASAVGRAKRVILDHAETATDAA